MPDADTTFDYCPVLKQLLVEKKATGRSGKVFEGLEALSTPNNLIMLRRMMMELKPQRTLEIGLSFGGSGLVFTSSHRDLGHTPMAQHVALDPFQSEVWDCCGLESIGRAGLEAYLEFKPVFSSIGLPAMLNAGRKFDLIYVDGSHIFEDVFIDAFYAVRLLEEGGIVTFDDSAKPHVAKVIRFLRRSLSHALVEVDLGSFRSDGGRPLKYLVAKMLGRTQMTAFRRMGNPERAWDVPFTRF